MGVEVLLQTAEKNRVCKARKEGQWDWSRESRGSMLEVRLGLCESS